MWESFLNALFPAQPSLDDELLAMQSFPIKLEESDLRKRGIMHITTLVAVCSYEASPAVRHAVHRLKYRSVKSLAVPLGRLLIAVTPLIDTERGTVLCPVPLHWLREFSRGFNQSQLLAERVSHSTGHPVVQVIRRIRHTGRQATRNREERLRAMSNAFCIEKNRKIPLHVILIDDVATTGSTLDACAKILKDAGAVRIDALTVAFKL